MNAFTQGGTIKFSKKEQARVVTKVSQPPRNARDSIASIDPIAQDALKALRFAHGERPPHADVKRWKMKG